MLPTTSPIAPHRAPPPFPPQVTATGGRPAARARAPGRRSRSTLCGATPCCLSTRCGRRVCLCFLLFLLFLLFNNSYLSFIFIFIYFYLFFLLLFYLFIFYYFSSILDEHVLLLTIIHFYLYSLFFLSFFFFTQCIIYSLHYLFFTPLPTISPLIAPRACRTTHLDHPPPPSAQFMTSSRCHLCHAGCTNTTAERIMKCSNKDCESHAAAPIDRDDNAVLNIAHRVLAAWLDPEGKSSSALRRPELLSRSSAVSAAAPASADTLSLADADELDDECCVELLAAAAGAGSDLFQA